MVPKSQEPKTKSVEGKLWETLRELADTEGKIKLFNTLKLWGIATNDVRNFLKKQTIHRKINRAVDNKVRLAAMNSKLKDAYALAKRLRQAKSVYKKRVSRKYLNNKSQGKKVICQLLERYRSYRSQKMEEKSKYIGMSKLLFKLLM